MAYKLPDLPYAYDALKPHIDARTMEIHHTKHHQGYTNKVNAALEGHEFANLPIEDVLSRINEVPEDIRQNVVNNGGGFANHKLFGQSCHQMAGGSPVVTLQVLLKMNLAALITLKKNFQPHLPASLDPDGDGLLLTTAKD